MPRPHTSHLEKVHHERGGGEAHTHTRAETARTHLLHLLVGAVCVNYDLVSLGEETLLPRVDVAVRERVVVEQVRVGHKGHRLPGAESPQSNRSENGRA